MIHARMRGNEVTISRDDLRLLLRQVHDNAASGGPFHLGGWPEAETRVEARPQEQDALVNGHGVERG